MWKQGGKAALSFAWSSELLQELQPLQVDQLCQPNRENFPFYLFHYGCGRGWGACIIGPMCLIHSRHTSWCFPVVVFVASSPIAPVGCTWTPVRKNEWDFSAIVFRMERRRMKSSVFPVCLSSIVEGIEVKLLFLCVLSKVQDLQLYRFLSIYWHYIEHYYLYLNFIKILSLLMSLYEIEKRYHLMNRNVSRIVYEKRNRKALNQVEEQTCGTNSLHGHACHVSRSRADLLALKT